MTPEKLAGILLECGLDAFSNCETMGMSKDDWNRFRLNIARRLLKKVEIKERKVKND